MRDAVLQAPETRPIMNHERPRLLDIEEGVEGFDGLADPLALVRRDALAHHAHVHAKVVDGAGDVIVDGVDLPLRVCPDFEFDFWDLDHGARCLMADAPKVLALCESEGFDEHLALLHRRQRLEAEDKLSLSKRSVVLELGFDVRKGLQKIVEPPFQSILEMRDIVSHSENTRLTSTEQHPTSKKSACLKFCLVLVS
jgi:hypothetical protein